MIVNQYKSVFKNELVNILARKLTKSVEASINAFMFKEGEFREIGENTGILLNCTLAGDPILEGDYMALPFDGTFAIDGEVSSEIEALRAKEIIDLPIHFPRGKQI